MAKEVWESQAYLHRDDEGKAEPTETMAEGIQKGKKERKGLRGDLEGLHLKYLNIKGAGQSDFIDLIEKYIKSNYTKK